MKLQKEPKEGQHTAQCAKQAPHEAHGGVRASIFDKSKGVAWCPGLEKVADEKDLLLRSIEQARYNPPPTFPDPGKCPTCALCPDCGGTGKIDRTF